MLTLFCMNGASVVFCTGWRAEVIIYAMDGTAGLGTDAGRVRLQLFCAKECKQAQHHIRSNNLFVSCPHR
jgi:hypothetical protein